jgi:mRNA-degrading endonuclease RelE of RelBE toxin-antitoxin system
VRYHIEISDEAEGQLRRSPRTVRKRLGRAIDELDRNDDSLWTNVKALQGPQWKGRLRKRIGDYRIILRKFPERRVAEISAILIRSKSTYE